MSKMFYTADLHLGHANIIKYCNRPFKDIDQMNETLIRNWNSRVKPDDTVIHNGDFCFKNTPGGKEGEGTVGVSAQEWLKKLNGHIVFVRGNHDRGNSLNTHIEKLYIRYGGIDICVVHRPEDCDLNMKYNFVGHVHNEWTFQKRDEAGSEIFLINVGVDCWNFMPATLEEIMKGLKKWQLGRGVGKQLN